MPVMKISSSVINTPIMLTRQMSNGSPNTILQKLMELLGQTTPRLNRAFMLLKLWATLYVALTRYSDILRRLMSLQRSVAARFTASISIPGSHSLNRQVINYLLNQGLDKDAKNVTLSKPKKIVECISMSPADLEKQALMRLAQRRLAFIPDIGSQFKFRGRRMTFERLETTGQSIKLDQGLVRVSATQDETIRISCTSLFGAMNRIKEFLEHVSTVQTAAENISTVTRVFHLFAHGTWGHQKERPIRNLAGITLDETVKTELVQDFATYLDPRTKTFYASRGIQYRRGYLFYGPPGTGKTSFAQAIAGHFGLDIFVIAASDEDNVDDHSSNVSLTVCLADALYCKTVPNDDSADKDNRRYITLSRLLNVLDGVEAAEGRIVIMTTNEPDSLDSALIRPGRIDSRTLFGYASRAVAAKLFENIYIRSEDEIPDGETAFDDDIPALAKEFAANLPANQLTPAELQGFLLVNRKDSVVGERPL
ncbi:P-loop containing nucleoside triphosphate hydrolase protein [Teratosphaeria nubilosa]|uniref:P-loop containing nucleoside triphosphate hydrolase protein n=1 Tax=Teratosphaeria nubilosa TaxID=161662 RepID=A0A6G1KX13_9PEZI|nr:P-loop containing nucleoside triphosphate hydrolase protein [Teratosphaeria nubilosa]